MQFVTSLCWQGATSCRSARFCDPGFRVLIDLTATTNRGCEACPQNFQTTSRNQATCTACPAGFFTEAAGETCQSQTSGVSCQAGTYFSFDEATSTPECLACGAGTFSTAVNQAGCFAWTECQLGERVMIPGTASSDRTCQPCAPGGVSLAKNSLSCTSCSPAQEQYQDAVRHGV